MTNPMTDNSAETVRELPTPSDLMAAGIPPAQGTEADQGWTIDFEYLDKISRDARKTTGYDATQEVVEFVINEVVSRSTAATVSRDREANHILCIGMDTLRRLAAGESVWIEGVQAGAVAADGFPADAILSLTPDDAGDAATLRGHIATFGETPSMTASDRDIWKSRAEATREALLHAKVRFDCLAEDFAKSGSNVDWAMCEVDAERMAKALAALPSLSPVLVQLVQGRRHNEPVGHALSSDTKSGGTA